MPQGGLFTDDFLSEGIVETPDWGSLDESSLNELLGKLRGIFGPFPHQRGPNEAQTENDLIWPVLESLGWSAYLQQQNLSSSGRERVPDGLLFADKEAKARANRDKQEWKRYGHGLAIVESKRWDRILDRADRKEREVEVPSTQMLRYLRRVDDLTDGKLRWGILTNGRHWRLYYQGARSVAEDFLELDLAAILGVSPYCDDLLSPRDEKDRGHWLKVFVLMFRREAFLPGEGGVRPFHRRALDEGRFWEERVAKSLSELVFERVFPALAQGLAKHDPKADAALGPAYLAEVRQGALVFLYRLLFVLYAEDRNLLPVRDSRYDDYGLRLKVREDVHRRMDARDAFSGLAANYYSHIKGLFRAIAEGDPSLGLPPYNGGLFESGAAPVLDRADLPDAVLAPVIDALSRHEEAGRKRYINCRDLSVQQLGSIYERLLEFELKVEGGKVVVRKNVFARKGSGSYYTPEELVGLIVQRAVGPLLDERVAAFEKRAAALKKERRPKAQKLAALAASDPASAFLDLKVCDPAMGSGHFLVSFVDYLADRVLAAMAEAEALVEWADKANPYVLPLGRRIAEIRERILEQAREHSWTLDESQLDDRHIVRRMILKRVIYGVDKNPMAVELAKVSLWLHTFTVGAPLSFLDHHLRCGDSLFGEWVRPVENELQKKAGLLVNRYVTQARQAAKGMARIEQATDADIAEVRESAAIFAEIREATAPLARLMAFVHALRWLDSRDAASRRAVDALFDGSFGDPVRIIAGLDAPTELRERPADALFPDSSLLKKELAPRRVTGKEVYDRLKTLLAEARRLAEEEGFLHWQVAFPGVWQDWESADLKGGFDAVIGNPPWDRIKLQEVEWFAARKPEIALAQTAAKRKNLVKKLHKANDPLAKDYDKAAGRAEAMSWVARTGGHFPLLSAGDINLYSLFVERALALVKPEGAWWVCSRPRASPPTRRRAPSSATSLRRAGSRRCSTSRTRESRTREISFPTWIRVSSSARSSPEAGRASSRPPIVRFSSTT